MPMKSAALVVDYGKMRDVPRYAIWQSILVDFALPIALPICLVGCEMSAPACSAIKLELRDLALFMH
jgi:hypothetical protein